MRNIKSRRRIRRPNGRKPSSSSRKASIKKPPEEEEPAAASDRSARNPGVPAAHRNELHSLLRPRHIPKPGIRLRRLALFLHHHQRRSGGGRPNLHGFRGQVRAAFLLPGSGSGDDLRLGGRGHNSSSQVRGRRGSPEGDRDLPDNHNLRVRSGVRAIVGAVGVAGAERDFSAGNAVGGAEHGGVREHDIHGVDGAVFSGVVVSLEIWHFLGVCGADCGDELFHLASVAGDEAGSD
nr:hypothetical protein C4D60_Mb01t29430 [Ipomoea batatas]